MASRITIGQNSLIVFDKRAADPFVSRQSSALVMINGELSGTLTSDDDAAFAFGVKLPSSDLTLVRRVQDENVEFLVTVNDDQSTTVNLHGGSAEITGRDGKLTFVILSITGGVRDTLDQSGPLEDRIDDFLLDLRGEFGANHPLGQAEIVISKAEAIDIAETIGSVFVTFFLIFGLFAIASGVLWYGSSEPGIALEYGQA